MEEGKKKGFKKESFEGQKKKEGRGKKGKKREKMPRTQDSMLCDICVNYWSTLL